MLRTSLQQAGPERDRLSRRAGGEKPPRAVTYTAHWRCFEACKDRQSCSPRYVRKRVLQLAPRARDAHSRRLHDQRSPGDHRRVSRTQEPPPATTLYITDRPLAALEGRKANAHWRAMSTSASPIGEFPPDRHDPTSPPSARSRTKPKSDYKPQDDALVAI